MRKYKPLSSKQFEGLLKKTPTHNTVNAVRDLEGS